MSMPEWVNANIDEYAIREAIMDSLDENRLTSHGIMTAIDGLGYKIVEKETGKTMTERKFIEPVLVVQVERISDDPYIRLRTIIESILTNAMNKKVKLDMSGEDMRKWFDTEGIEVTIK